MNPYTDEMDPETLRSFSRQIYGHEMWLSETIRDGNSIGAYGLYGHNMVPDYPMPTDYANVLLYDDNGRTEDPDREIVKKPHGWFFSFEDKGADVYTMYIDANSTWVTDDAGWHRGVKRNFSNVKYSGAFSMVAKRIFSKDGVNPGSVIHSPLELMPEKATLTVGEDMKIRVLFEGNPMKDIKVSCYAEDDEDQEILKSDADGYITYRPKKAVLTMFIAKYTDSSRCVEDEFDETSYKITLTLEAKNA